MPIRPDFSERDLARARRILSSWTSLKRLSSDEADIIARMIAQGIAEGRRSGLELAEAVRFPPVSDQIADIAKILRHVRLVPINGQRAPRGSSTET